MKVIKFAVLLFAMIISGCGPGTPGSGDKLYDGFKNPPASAGPFERWQWDTAGPTEKDVINRLDAVKKDGFGGVEIYPLENINAPMLKFTTEAAKKRGLLVDLALGSTLTAQNLPYGRRGLIITLAKKNLSGPMTYTTTMNEMLYMPDETRPVAPRTRRRLMFYRLIPKGLSSFQPGTKPTGKSVSGGSIAFDVPDGNYTFYVGVLHEISAAGPDAASNVPVLDVLNKQAVEKYFSDISDKLRPAFGDKLSGLRNAGIHAISCDNVDLFGADWTGDFAEQFLHRRKYDVLPYLPVVLDNTLPKKLTRFYDTTRRVRYDFCLTFADMFDENFIQTFRRWRRDNGVGSRLNVTDVNILFFLKGVPEANSVSPRILFGDNRLFAGGNARLSYLFDNSARSSQVAVLLPIPDFWSDCGLYGAGRDDYIWYLFPLRLALSHIGFTADYINEQVLSQATYDDGKLRFGSNTWDAVIVPDVCSIEFPAAKTLRFFAKAGGKIAFIGGYPDASPGFKDLLKRTLPVQITMEHIRKEYRDRALVFLPPEKDKDNLVSWAAGLTEKLGLSPAVKISPVSNDLLFDHYVAGNRDIFFFINTSQTEPISFNARFDIANKIPVVWDPQTGDRSIFPSGQKADGLDIRLEPRESLLLVFEPVSKSLP